MTPEADPVGRIGAWFVTTTSIVFGFPVGWAAPWRAAAASGNAPLGLVRDLDTGPGDASC
jgi:hypothetical protein